MKIYSQTKRTISTISKALVKVVESKSKWKELSSTSWRKWIVRTPTIKGFGYNRIKLDDRMHVERTTTIRICNYRLFDYKNINLKGSSLMIKIVMDKEPFDPEKESVRIVGELRARYYIGPWEYENYIENTRHILFEFLYNQNRFPLYITFEPYDGLYKDIEAVFDKEGIEHSIKCIPKERESFPVMNVIAKEPKSLQIVLEEAFWLASSNQFFAISFEDNIRYEIAAIDDWYGKMVQFPLPHFIMSEDSTVLTLYHDAQGFYIFTNDKRYSSIEDLRNQLPGTRLNLE